MEHIKLLEEIKNEKLIKDFILVGGTALSVQLHHRESSDLDFIYFVKNKKKGYMLNRILINKIIDNFKRNGKKVIMMEYSDAEIFEFAEVGEDIKDVHQNYMVDNVKISFFVSPDLTNDNILDECKPIIDKNLRIADINTLSRQKINLLVQRNKIRDYFDVYYLLKNNYISKQMILDELKMAFSINNLLYNINRIDKFKDDEGFRMLSNTKINIKTIKKYFKTLFYNE